MKISAIVSPFATAATALFVILSLLEHLRPRFVSLFLDFRLIAGAVVILWLAAVATEEEQPRHRFWPALFVVLALAFSLPILYRSTAPFGKLGALILIAGALTFIVVCAVTMKRPAYEKSPEDSSSL